MSLTDDQYVRLQALLQGLDGEQLYASAQSFVRDQIEREKKYGQDMFLSQKQARWLEDLYVEKVGQLPGARLDAGVQLPERKPQRMARPMRDDEAEEPEIGDEIPY